MTRLLLFVVLLALATSAYGGVFPFGVELELSRTFPGNLFGVGQSVPVSVTFSSDEPSRLSGFFYSEQFPYWIRLIPQNVYLNGDEVEYTLEEGELGEIMPGLTPFRWILDCPDSGDGEVIENGDELIFDYILVANEPGDFRFDTDGWFGALIDYDGQAAMGYDDESPHITFGTVATLPAQAPPVALLEPAWPNPFNPRTNITFQVLEQGSYRLEIFGVTGRLVTTLTDDLVEPGRHELVWDGTGDDGRGSPSGLYMARLSGSGGVLQSQRLVLLK